MADEVTQELFDHLVDLAALELSPEEAEYLRGELNRQLRVIHELADIPLPQGTPIASHGVPYLPADAPELREDVAEPSGLATDILLQAPDMEDGSFVVPDIPHETL